MLQEFREQVTEMLLAEHHKMIEAFFPHAEHELLSDA
jgi:hypothetical protein